MLVAPARDLVTVGEERVAAFAQAVACGVVDDARCHRGELAVGGQEAFRDAREQRRAPPLGRVAALRAQRPRARLGERVEQRRDPRVRELGVLRERNDVGGDDRAGHVAIQVQIAAFAGSLLGLRQQRPRALVELRGLLGRG